MTTTLIFTYGYPPSCGGVQVYTEGIAKGLWKLGETVVVLAPYCKGCEESDYQQPFPIYRCPSNLFIRELWMLITLPKLVKKYKVTRILNTVWLPCGLISWLVTRFVKVPYYLSAHSSEILDTQNIKTFFKHHLRMKLRFLKMKTLWNAVAIFSVSQYTRKLVIAEGISPDKVYAIPNGVDSNRFQPMKPSVELRSRHKLEGQKVIITIARLDDFKGHDTVIRAFPKVLAKVPQAVYLIVGKGSERVRLEKLAKDKGAKNRVIFAGYVPDHELVAYYNISDVFVMVTKIDKKDFEGFGLVYLEANACGKPVIGSNTGGISDAIVNNQTGLIVEANNEDAVARAIIRLLIDKDEASRMGENGRKRVKNEMDWIHIATRMQNIMNMLERKYDYD